MTPEERKRRRARVLHDLKIGEVSLVDRGANQEADIVFYKRESEEKDKMDDIEKLLDQQIGMLDAVEKGDLGAYTSDDFDEVIEATAKRYAEQNKVTVAEAYVAISNTPSGRQLCEGYNLAKRLEEARPATFGDLNNF